MLTYSIKPLLNLIPEAAELIKQASINEDLPYDSKDSVLASALAIEYEKRLGSRTLPFDSLEKIAVAVDLYDLRDTVNQLSDLMVSRSNQAYMRGIYGEKEKFLQKQAEFESTIHTSSDTVGLHTYATDLIKEAIDKNLTENLTGLTELYSTHNMCLDKSACLQALSARYSASQEPAFLKVAESVSAIPIESFKGSVLQSLIGGIAELDKMAHLDTKGFDPFREMLKKSAQLPSMLTIRLDNKDVPYEDIEKLGKDKISTYLGKDIADAMTDPETTKHVLETLPLDLQKLCTNLLKNI